MLDNLKKYKIVLGSQSPRRKELLSGLDIRFEQKAMPDIAEDYPADLDPEKVPLYLARMKAEAYRSKGMMQDSTLLITADTVVIIDGTILGKPQDREEAARMLRTLSGRTHQVVTGVCVSHRSETRAFSCSSLVTFAHLSDEEIDYYLERYRPYDKAGSYGIQEWIGYIAIQRVEGSFYNVMGLPVHLLYNELKDFGESN